MIWPILAGLAAAALMLSIYIPAYIQVVRDKREWREFIERREHLDRRQS